VSSDALCAVSSGGASPGGSPGVKVPLLPKITISTAASLGPTLALRPCLPSALLWSAPTCLTHSARAAPGPLRTICSAPTHNATKGLWSCDVPGYPEKEVGKHGGGKAQKNTLLGQYTFLALGSIINLGHAWQGSQGAPHGRFAAGPGELHHHDGLPCAGHRGSCACKAPAQKQPQNGGAF